MKKSAFTLFLCSSVPLFLAACGYTPLYAPHGEATPPPVTVGSVDVSSPRIQVGERRTAQLISQRLRQAYPHDNPTYDTLAVVVREETSELAVQRNATVQRASLALIGTVKLTGPQGKLKLQTDVTTSAPYNVQATPYGTESGKTYARQTAAANMADEIQRLLAIYYR